MPDGITLIVFASLTLDHGDKGCKRAPLSRADRPIVGGCWRGELLLPGKDLRKMSSTSCPSRLPILRTLPDGR